LSYLFESLPLKFWLELHDIRFIWQAAALLLCLALAGALTWYTKRQLNSADDPVLHKMLGGLLRRMVFPASALLLLTVAKETLHTFQGISLLHIAIALLTALAISRAFAYVLRLVLPAGGLSAVFERAISWLIWSGFALHVLGLAPAIINFFDEITFHIGKQKISLLGIAQAGLWIMLALLLTLWLSRVIEEQLMSMQRMEMTLRVMLTKLLRPLLILLTVLLVLPAVGIDLTALSVFGGALGVGIGFGLQKIASNYISGFIILLDRSIKIGDIVTIESQTGRINKMTARCVVVRGGDGTEALIPNEAVITSSVLNHTYSDSQVCVMIPLQIGYRSDLDVATSILIETARNHPRVLPAPAPRVIITAFADSGINLELGVWIGDPELGGALVRSDIYRSIWREFKAQGIEIPYPQREVRMLGEGPSQA